MSGREQCRPSSGPAVIVGNSDDVVLAKVRSGLNFNKMQEKLARVFELMLDADRNIDRFVFAQNHRVRAALDARGALHDGPMLRAMKMLLQAELAARFNGYPLDLKPFAHIDAAVMAPRAVNGKVLLGLRSISPTQLLNDLRHVAG